MATIVQKQRGVGGLETTIQRTGLALFAVASLLGLGVVGLGFVGAAASGDVSGLAMIAATATYAVLVALSGFCMWLVFRGFAEHLRVQKYIAGLPYAGDIDVPSMRAFVGCSACLAEVNPAATACPTCGESFASPATPDQTTGSALSDPGETQPQDLSEDAGEGREHGDERAANGDGERTAKSDDETRA